MAKNDVGFAFSDHVFEEKIRHRRDGSSFRGRGLFRLLPLAILLIVFVLLSLRLFTLQIVRASYYSRLSDENRIRTVLVTAPRGIIFDRNGEALVRNIPAYGTIKNGKIEWLSNDEALKKMSKGEKVGAAIKREYVYKDIFSHVIGYVGQVSEEELLLPQYDNYGISDFVGRLGLEQQYERILHGQNGKQLYEVNAKGEMIRLLGEVDAQVGGVLPTTLDINIQKAVHSSMQNIDRGAVIITDPRDGSVLALYSKPTFDPNIFTRESTYIPVGTYKSSEEILTDDNKFPLLNRVVSGVYPPGSTYKLVTSIATLESNAIDKKTEIEDTGVLEIGGSKFGTWNFLEHGKKEGKLDVVAALKRSNDIFFYKAAMKAGIGALSSWSKNLGLGKTTGIDLPGEVEGIIPNPDWKKKTLNENWYMGDTINMSIGQGYLETTPIQVNLYTQFVANGGILYQPHLISGATKVLKKDFVNTENINVVRDGMKAACELGGTGYPMFGFKIKNEKLKIDGLDYTKTASTGAGMLNVTMGCKTGTSESHGYEAKSHAWFTVFAPFYNPEITITVLAENAGQGSDVAAPVAKEIMTKYFESKKNN